SISHTYAKPGTFPAKLMVRNFIGDEHERSVSLEVTVGSSASPVITALDVVPVTANLSAPATFRLVAQTTNAERLIWDTGGDRQPDVISETTARQEKFVTLAAPGDHLIQITALNGNQAVKRAAVVHVDPPPPGTLVARLRVTDRGMRSSTLTKTERLPITLAKN